MYKQLVFGCNVMSSMNVVSELYFQDLKYTDIYIDGQIDGVRNLSLGQGVNFVIGENVSQSFKFTLHLCK